MGGVRNAVYGGELSPIRDAIGGALSSVGNGIINENMSNVALKVASSAVLGGTISEIGGGKFANGAVTGAYSMLFNELQHNITQKMEEKTLEHKLKEKLAKWKVGESISGEEFAKVIGSEKISLAVSKATRISDTEFKIDKNPLGKTLIKGDIITVTRTTLYFNSVPDLVYNIRIPYYKSILTQKMLFSFYLNDNKIWTINNKGKFYEGSMP